LSFNLLNSSPPSDFFILCNATQKIKKPFALILGYS